MRPLSLLLFLALTIHSFAQKSLIQSGPMLGYSEMKEVLLWVQTQEPASVKFQYWDQQNPGQKFYTDTKSTIEAEAYTAKLLADEVEPGRRYTYQLYINEVPVRLDYPTEFQTQHLWQWRTDPPDFTIALGSCSYVNEKIYDRPGDGYGGEYEIFRTIHRQRPDAMLWLGDNIYLREVDWFTTEGIHHRYTHTRSLSEMQPLLASTHHYAIWDDHDYGPNNSDRSFIHKEKTLDAFRLFWGNPTYGLPGQGGITTYFQWADIDFFLLDDRYFRAPNQRKSGNKPLLGENQLQWLIDALVKSDAPFKMVAIGGQVLSDSQVHENYVHYHTAERARLLELIAREGIKNVVFLTGDRHHTELSMLTNAAGNVLHDLTVSPLTSGPASNVETDNNHRQPGTLVTQRNFGLLEFSGPRDARRLKVTIHAVDGKVLWEKTIQSVAD